MKTTLSVLAFAATLGLSLPARCQETVSPQAEEARERGRNGVRMLEASPPDPNGAIAEFQRAYDLLEGSPRRYQVNANIGRCLVMLGQYDRALLYYHRFLSEGGEGSPDGPGVQSRIEQLEDVLGAIEVQSNVAAEVWLDNRQVGEAPGTVRVPGGRHRVELRARGYSSAQQEVDVTARRSVRAAFTLDVINNRGISPVFFWSGVGLTAVSVGIGTVFGVQALSARSDVDTRLASTDPRVRFTAGDADAAHLRSLSLTADVFFASAVVLGVGTAVLLLVTNFHRSPAEAQRARFLVAPSLAAGARGLDLAVTF